MELEVADLTNYEFGTDKWDAIVSIFCHLPPQLRRHVYKQTVQALKPGGILILEAYTPKQLEYKTGGPPVAEMMCTLDGLREELVGLEFEIGEEKERNVVEGTLHTGLAHVVQVFGRKK
jgi:SAM-dependent methyltransferase